MQNTTGADSTDKAGREYWDRQWEAPGVRSHARSRVAGYRTQKQLAYFQTHLSKFAPEGKEILELGCASSEWLPRFAGEFGLNVAGLDYSEQGCQMAREMLARHRVSGEIYCADLFAPPAELLNRFDFIVSFGLVEHFEDLTGCLRATSRFLKSGGIAFTCIPNLAGLVGLAQRWLGPQTFGVHIPWDREGLTTNLKSAGFEILNAEYVMVHDFACCSVDEVGGPLSRKTRETTYSFLKRLTAVAMLFESRIGYYPLNKQTAAYVYTTARKL
jgi:2-polyprenyl-3-methyl-5-hydroxy-6-metoxy-1,4-benzoquinol methylase